MGDLFFTILLWGIPILLLVGVRIVDKKIRTYLNTRGGSKLTNTLIYIILSLVIVAIVLISSFVVFMILMSLPGATM
ncbi:hypothetical protein OFO01_06200 [Campylobacter sp. JMF_01 NE2]|uniref:hypothetical protein n=1 Tax=unclassified Campylobacter TaxID=2593542 RepID=UPI0022E9A0F8|nr:MULTISPECIES: hypothetical protein [unclassified Campylobacter]MDA3053040.1 hypothetical protein [Campylobacter sp. JMF_03 NE3]MDA3054266.1 hypothetical protein [Campylobacter sp. VBCF_07 NA4]MDA3060957.1 hypothetical protein [Campylobacter sp. VBCF_02 NA5]MDA3067371.1 hypothetical protein [Campylobacter sp. JMF_01 NE2]MDA3070470.1 hypothetical protein [Campylobacter sp. VBCF_08 NA3]